MTVISFLPILAGLGLFLFGMHQMGISLEKLAGSRMEKTLERLTASRMSGVLLGVAVTAVIQSSSATTVMVVGFVNAGIMRLSQAVSVIMGANIGTTVTAQIIRLSELSEGGNILLSLLKPSSFAPILIIIGAALMLFAKDKRKKDIGALVFGFGCLFFGMNTMEKAMAPLRDSDMLKNAFANFENPFLGLLLGTGVTAVIQSSSASVGLLQALSTTGAISFAMMVPVILGQNIGTCVTALLASIGAKKNAKRAAMVHLYFNIIGTIVFFAGVYGWQYFVGFSYFNDPVNMGDIANFHTLFNLVCTLLLLPFCGGLVKLAELTVRDKKQDPADEANNILEERFLATPSVAVEQCRKMTNMLGKVAAENVTLATKLLNAFDRHVFADLEEKENFCDKTESRLSEYLVKVTALSLTEHDSQLTSEMLHTVSDFERISDRAVNLAQVAEYNTQNNITFTEDGKRELDLLGKAVEDILKSTLKAYEVLDRAAAKRIEPLEEVIDVMTEELKNRHVKRLQSGSCTIEAGISFLEALSNYERVADHCSNIAIYIIQMHSGNPHFDPHEHTRKIRDLPSEEYKAFYAYYENLYYSPITAGDK